MALAASCVHSSIQMVSDSPQLLSPTLPGYLGVCVLDKDVAARLALEQARLVKQIIELGDLAELGEYFN